MSTAYPSRVPNRHRWIALACLGATFGWSLHSPPPAQARVNPLVIIERQLHKGNMLIVLDTSGSMTGVPGGLFANSSEAGVDCDDGVNCRMGGVLGICQHWGRTCQSDDDCRTGYCQQDGVTHCNSTADCPQDPGQCSVPTRTCAETTRTETGTTTRTGSGTATGTTTLTGHNTATTTKTQTGTKTTTTTKTVTTSTTDTARVTARATVTITGTVTSTNTAYYSDWPPDWWHTNTYTTTSYLRGTGTDNTTSVVTATYNDTATRVFTVTGTVTATLPSTDVATVYMDTGEWYTTVSKVGWHVYPATVTESGTATGTRSVSWRITDTLTDTGTGTDTGTKTTTGTLTTTGTTTTTGTPTGTTTITTSSSGTEIGTQTVTDLSCTVSNATCSESTPCPELTASVCSATGVACEDPNNPCQTLGSCKYTHILCSNPGGNCPDVSVCGHTTSTTCTSPSDCPPTSATGTCSVGGTPQGGCTGNNDCPSYKTCSSTYDSCRVDSDCPAPSSGVCSGTGARCNNGYLHCPSPQTCIFTPQTCNGTDNVCNLAQDTCIPKTDNTCTAVTNTCDTPTNTCIYPPENVCVPPVSGTDICAPSPQGTPGPIRMCRVAQTVCKKDSDCTIPGDLCGPATARDVIAKRAITSVVNNNYKVLNFGLMTFYQDGYFPYYRNTSGSTSVVTVFEARDKLAGAHCYNRRTGPAHTCRINNIDMTLRGSPTSRYRVRADWRTWVDVDADWCGYTCEMPSDQGLGTFVGAYYEYSATTGTPTTTVLRRTTYDGPDITMGTDTYSYYKPLTNYYNGGKAPPLDFPDCGSTCSAECGGRWDPQLAPFLSTSDDDPTASEAAAAAIAQAMSPAANGGLITYWGTPTGCTLQNNVARTINTSAYDYMKAVKDGSVSDGIPADPLSCRDNYVLLITDGEANGPGDSNCSAAACAASNPASAGCTCRSVLAAYNMRHDLGVRTFVVGFAGDSKSTSARTTNDNIARAGGTDNDGDGVAPFAYFAENEAELNDALQLVIYEAVKGSYSTAPTSTSAGTQQATTVAEGRYALDSRMDFPEWRGHLLAYDLSGDSPVLAWDSYQKLAAANWWERRVYTWDGTNMVKIEVDPATKAVTNSNTLATLGMGASAAEAEAVARWMLGDPTYSNPAALGALINSTPIDVASPGDLVQPGGHNFFLQHRNRPHIIYVGSSDALLHAFFLENTTIGGTTYQAGSEAFAFLPPDMIPVVRQQYSQGGQRPDPYAHIFGLADSPKVKTLCVQHCDDALTAVWKTVLIMPEGYGGNETFMLDVGEPFGVAGLADPPIRVLWHTGFGASASTYDSLLGNTISLPAFFFNRTNNMDDYRVAFASGYAVTTGSTTQGRAMITASASDGSLIAHHAVAPAAACAQEYAALTDFATARDFATGQDNKLIAGYFGDTSGQLFRYLLNNGVTLDQSMTCDHPLHFSPTVVQLDRDALTTSHGHQIFLVQVTNSNLDLDTGALPPSKIVVWKEDAVTDSDGGVTSVVKDTTWRTGGQITLTVGNDNEICGVTATDANGVVTCTTSMPLGARPTATPIGVLLADASGFEILTMWYVASPDGCTRGQTYFTLHRIYANGNTEQRVGAMVANEPVTSPVILGGRIYLFGATGAIEITGLVPSSITAGRAIPSNGGTGKFVRYNWTEIP